MTNANFTEPRIIVALDFSESYKAMELASLLDPSLCRLKIGKELFTLAGPQLVEEVMKKGFDVFLDLKFHDIPNTVGKACKVAASLGVWMLNVHTLGGLKMLTAAREAIAGYHNPPLLIGVTVLTSHSDQDLTAIGLQDTTESAVLRLANLAKQSGLDGVVCSPLEITSIRQQNGTDFCLVTPGIRPQGSVADDQSRITTPAQAIKLGADYLVVGRPITQAVDPLKAVLAIADEIKVRS